MGKRGEDHRVGGLLQREIAHGVGVLQLVLDAAGLADTRDRGRSEGEDDRFVDACKLLAEAADDGVDLFLGGLTLVPVVKDNDRHGVIRRDRAREQREALHAEDVFDAVLIRGHVFDAFEYFEGAFALRAVGELDVDEEVALVFVGQEAGGDELKAVARGEGDPAEEQHGHDGQADAFVDEPEIPAAGLVERRVKELKQREADGLGGLEDQGAEHRAERQRVDGREAGGKDNYPWIHIPVGYFKTMHNPDVDWCYKTEPDESMNDISIRYPRGKTLGGSSSINGLLYVRGQHRDYDVWRQLGNTGWSWDDVLPYFIKAENQERGKSEFHGVGGPLSVSDQRIQLPLLNEFQNAAEEFGIPKTKDFNTGDNHGCGYFQVTEKDGFRCSTAVGYLNPIKNRKNLKIITKAHVKKINFENKTAKEVEYWQENELKKVKANKEIILSSGAIGSPQILQVSGIGNTDKLKNLGIDVVHELKGVGENLQDHLMFRPIYKIHGIKSLNKKVNSLFGNLMIGLEYIFNRSGPMTMGASQLCMFAKSDPSLELPDLQWHVQPMSMDTLGATKNHDFHAFTPTVSNVRPSSRGHVSIVDKDSRTYAKIKMNYLSTDEDRRIAAKGLKLTRKIVLESETFKKYSPEEYRPGININDDEELVKEASNYAQTIFHPVGTCKMGQDDMAVVDEKLKVKGIKNLRVIDASIMPNITSGNTNAPTIMIAEKGADMILEH